MKEEQINIFNFTKDDNNYYSNKEDMKEILNYIKNSETILKGEYYVIHSDFIILLEEKINKLIIEEN